MKYLYAMLVLAIFGLGIGVGGLISLHTPESNLEVSTTATTTRALNFNTVQLSEPKQPEPLKADVSEQVLGGPIERPSPGDWIKENQIEMKQDGVFIHLNNPQWAIVANTNSMDPVLDDTSHLIQVAPTSKDQIQVGDIMSYQSPLGFSIVHRVIEIGNDEDGWYAIMKGDNNPQPDPWKVRFDMVTRVTVMIVY